MRDACMITRLACDDVSSANKVESPEKTDFARRLIANGQSLWTSPTRLSCLVLILRRIAAESKTPAAAELGVPFSNRLARSYASKLRAAPVGVEREPLAALERAGLIEKASPHVANAFLKRSARWRLTQASKAIASTWASFPLSDGARRKQSAASERLERGLNQRWKFRAQLLCDLGKLTLADSPQARECITALLRDNNSRPSAKAVLGAIATREHAVKVQPSGQITTSLNSCPKLLKPHLRIEGEPVALCDISSAHWAFLPRLVSDRIEFLRKRTLSECQANAKRTLEPLANELHRLIELCSSGSFYESTLPEGATPEDVKRRKKLLNVLLNSPRSKSANNCLWRSLRARFPHCISIIDAIKGDDHRLISRQLQHFTAAAISNALLEMQARELPAIPDTDCLIVRQRDHAAACEAIGRAMHKETRGVCVTAGGIRYSPNNSKPPP